MNVQAIAKQPEAAGKVPLLSIFTVFFRIGMFSFGGGLSGWVYREVVLIRPWLNEEEFMSGLALSQIMPGANVTNLSVYIGLKLRGLLGAGTALLGLLAVPFFAIIGLLAAYDTVSSIPWLTPALDGVTAGAIGLLILMGWKGGTHAATRIEALVALVATFVMVGILKWPLLLVVFIVGPLSVAAAWIRKRRDA